MNIVAISDLHGFLPRVEKCDVVTISGDISPLHIQRWYSLMLDWFKEDFIPWCMSLPCDKVIFIAGNHDFACSSPNWKMDFSYLLDEQNGAREKIVYLENESYTYKEKVFFGCPYSDIPYWAFSIDDHPWGYNDIEPDVDVLLVHQAPDYNGVGTTEFDQNYGSEKLFDVIKDRKPKYVLCGHIHSGNHDKVVYEDTIIYNVSIKDENYEPSYYNDTARRVITI